jgi:peptidoglycan hydrolase-like protein with peptidoglycan-binding domain
MKLQNRNLNVGLKGSDVKLLQSELAQIGFVIAGDEIADQLFGKSTDNAVRSFQEKRGLKATGVVDEVMAKLINTEVDALQSQPKQDTKPKQDEKPQFEDKPKPDVKLKQQRVTLEVPPTKEKPAPPIQETTKPVAAGQPDKPKQDDQQQTDGKPPLFIVRGQVRETDGTAVAGNIVRAFDKDLPSLRGEEELGKATTDKDGRYEITYTAEQFRRAEKKTADLIVRVFNEGPTPVASSPIIFNAGPEETLDLVVEGSTLSEYERYLKELSPLVERIRIADLNEEDLVFLNGETGINKQHLSFLIIAATLLDKTKLPAEVFYGLFRQNLPTDLPALLAQGIESLRTALNASLNGNIIPSRLGAQLEDLFKSLKALLVQSALQPPGEEKSSLGALLDLSLPKDKQVTLLTRYVDHEGEIAEFWQKLREDPEFKTGGQVEKLQFTLQLGVLTGNNVPLVQALQKDKSLATTQDLTRLNLDAWTRLVKDNSGNNIPPYIKGESAEEKVTNYSQYILETLKSAFPTRYVQKGIADHPNIDLNLVKQVRDLNPDLDPTAPLPDNLNWGTMTDADKTKASNGLAALRSEIRMFPDFDHKAALSGAGNKAFQNPIRQSVATFLANATDFDFGDTHIDSYVAEHAATAFKGIPESHKAAVTSQLKATQRVYKVVPRYEAISSLMAEGLDSAQVMASMPEGLFNRQFAERMGGEFYASMVWESAVDTRDQALVAFGNAAEITRAVNPRVIGPSPSIRSMSDYAELFGRFDLCECEHCRSVYSPAAYFVDLLHFLDPEWWFFSGAKPIDVLFARRHDLQRIELTCENTNTRIPYIDLVNEILETYVAVGSTFDRETLSNQTPTTSAELMANPQHLNVRAYDRLKEARYPMNLPFNRDVEVVRAYLEHLGSSRYAVLKTFQRDPLARNAELERECEYLKLTPEERDALTSGAVRRLYGFSDDARDNAWQNALAAVEEFLERTDLKYAELEELLKTRFINPVASLTAPGAVVIFAPNDSCDPAERRLRHHDGSSLSAEEWDKLQRFIRLWRKLGWPIHDLDRALTALRVSTAGQVNDDFLITLGQAVRLQGDLHLTLADTLSFWSNIDTHGDDLETRRENSLYARLFLNRTVRQLISAPAGDPFLLNDEGSELQRTTGHISDFTAAILAALRISAADLAVIRSATNLEDRAPVVTPLTLANLSTLYRYAVLARALRVSVQDLISLRQLTGMDPFSVVIAPDGTRTFNPSVTLQFVEKVKKVQQSAFSVAQLNYIYRHVSEPVGAVAPRQDDITSCLQTIRTGLRNMAADAGAQEPAEELMRKQVVQMLSTALALDAATTETLIASSLRSRAIAGRPMIEDFLALRAATSMASATEAFRLLHKAALLVKGFKMTSKEEVYLSSHGSDFVGIDPAASSISAPFDLNNLPLEFSDPFGLNGAHFSQWERLFELFALRNTQTQTESTLFDVFAAAGAGSGSAAASQTTIDKLKAATGWDAGSLVDLIGPTGFNLTNNALKNEIVLRRVEACLRLSKRLGVSAKQLFGWAQNVPDALQAQEVRNAVKAKYEDAQWLTIAKGLNDGLRERQRSALVAHVLTLSAIKNAGVRDSNQLFEYFLIDVDMSACMSTSRIKQAISSVQLFVQRYFMNLEQRIPAGVLKADHWKWMRNYRVWEANRKIFLYPENWIEPELRDDKSQIFKDLENELLQNDVTQETAEAALLNYLEKLDEVARLDIRGLYWEVEPETTWDGPEVDAEERADVLHVFGRTQGKPPIYYYRRFMNHRTWTPWEKVQADIEGDHMVPVVYNRRLYLFWSVFNVITDPDQAPPQPGPDGRPPAGRQPNKHLEIKLAWCEYKDKKWSAKKTSFAKLTTDYVPEERRSSFFFTTRIDGELLITCHLDPDQVRLNPDRTISIFIGSDSRVGEWRFGGCDNRLDAVSINGPEDALLWAGRSYRDGQSLSLFHAASSSGPSLWLGGVPGPLDFREVLRSLPGPRASSLRIAQTIYPHQYHPYFTQAPFFYQDNYRTYVATPEQVAERTVQIAFLPTIVLSQLSQNSSGGNGSAKAQTSLVSGKAQAVSLATTGVSTGTVSTATAGETSPSLWTEQIVCPEDRQSDFVQPGTSTPTTTRKLRFAPLYHPYVCDFVKALKRGGISGLLDLDNQRLTSDPLPRTTFDDQYRPNPALVHWEYPRENVDFERGAYSLYNWELFFHAPLLIATRLSKNQRFEEAREWFHYIFDPTDDSDDEAPRRFWKMLPFHQNDRVTQDQISELLRLLSYSGSDPVMLERKRAAEDTIREWQDNPFNPHLIARMRITAYQKTVVMKYIDNLIGWGDQLFRQDTIESINQATQLYVLAYLMLGPRPEAIPPREKVRPKTYADLRHDLDLFSNALVQTENAIAPRRCVPLRPRRNGGTPGGATLGATFYFCVPPNDKLLGYWDLVADRLFKIRHCMNIEGVVRQLPLFEPPLDPALLVRARAAGLDLSTVLSDVNVALPAYRFHVMVQKAHELCAEVKSLGAAMLPALEKRDAEALSALRSTHEIRLLEAVGEVKRAQIEEAERTLEGLQRSQEVISARRDFYQNIARINPNEQAYMDNLGIAHVLNEIAQGIQASVSAAHLIPLFDVGVAGWAASPLTTVSFGGQNLGSALQAAAGVIQMISNHYTHDATMASIVGGYNRRWEEWKHQENLANKELDQIAKQIAAATIRRDIAKRELEIHELQIENAKAVDEYMRSKFTNRELYDWMSSQISALYFQSYQMAYDIAKRAERTYQFERGLTASSFIQFGYWDSLKKGLLAGERLHLDLTRLEMAYLDQNKREYEITRNISLLTLDPLALLRLRETGAAEFNLSEELFDIDYPGQYMRRIKSVSLTIPCVVGPYSGINCTLTLVSSKTRIWREPASPYAEREEDDRFVAGFPAEQSIAISHAQNDSGVFDLNFRDERYLPFECWGAISHWRIEMPRECNRFDFNTISDVVMHLKYTARDGGEELKRQAKLAIINPTPPRPRTGTRLFSARHEFVNEWHRFLHPDEAARGQTLTLDLKPEQFPFHFQGQRITVNQVELFLNLKDGRDPASTSVQTYSQEYSSGDALRISLTRPGGAAETGELISAPEIFGGLPHVSLPGRAPLTLPATLTLMASDDDIRRIAQGLRRETATHQRLNADAIEDVFIVCHYAAD